MCCVTAYIVVLCTSLYVLYTGDQREAVYTSCTFGRIDNKVDLKSCAVLPSAGYTRHGNINVLLKMIYIWVNNDSVYNNNNNHNNQIN